MFKINIRIAMILGILVLAFMLFGVPKIISHLHAQKRERMIEITQIFSDKIKTSPEFELPSHPGNLTIVSLDLITLEEEIKKSPFGGRWQLGFSYIVITNEGNETYKYYLALVDSRRYTIELTPAEKINSESLIRPRTMSRINGALSLITEICSNEEPMVKDTSQTFIYIHGLDKPENINRWTTSIYSSLKCR